MTPSQIKMIEQAFALARERYAELGVDVEKALERLSGGKRRDGRKGDERGNHAGADGRKHG